MDYLQRLGFDRETGALPLKVVVEGHAEEAQCTLYEMRCTLGTKGEPGYTQWRCRKRLCTLREDLHDPLKEALGPVYVAQFEETPFAKYGGLPGTTARLADWFRTESQIVT